jgi:non-specific serine/threonine protein kinase
MNEGCSFLERVLAASAGAAPALRAKALAAAADLAFAQDNYQRGEELAAEGLVLCREVGDKAGTAFCLYTLGIFASIRGEHARACSLLEESVALGRELGNKNRLGYSLLALADTYLVQGEYVRARPGYEETLALFREQGLHC